MENPLEQVTLDRLMRPTKQVSVAGRVFTVRALTDLERNLRFRAATLARSKISRKLDDPNSEEHLVNFGDYASSTDEELRDVIAIFRRRDAWMQATKSVQYNFIPYPDEATEEERDAVNKQREDMLDRLNKERDAFVDKYIADLRKGLENGTREALLAEYMKAAKENILLGAFNEEADFQTLYISLDGKMPMEDVRGLHPSVRQKLLEAVMEVDNIDPLLLKWPASTESLQAQPG